MQSLKSSPSDPHQSFTLPEDPRRTPSITLIEHHYSKNKVARRTIRWFIDLALLIKATPYELGALCGLSIDETETLINRAPNLFVPLPVAIHAALIESWYLDAVLFVRNPKPVVPIHILAAAQHLEETDDRPEHTS